MNEITKIGVYKRKILLAILAAATVLTLFSVVIMAGPENISLKELSTF